MLLVGSAIAIQDASAADEVISIRQSQSELRDLFGNGFDGRNSYGPCSLRVEYFPDYIIFKMTSNWGSGGETYIDLMRTNAERIAAALG